MPSTATLRNLSKSSDATNYTQAWQEGNVNPHPTYAVARLPSPTDAKKLEHFAYKYIYYSDKCEKTWENLVK